MQTSVGDAAAVAAFNQSNRRRATVSSSAAKIKSTENYFISSPTNSSFFYSSANASHFSMESSNESPPPPGYLVWSEYCKMPNLNPYLPEVMKNFHREKYKPCKLISPLTQVEFNRTTQRYVLYVDQEVIPGFSKTGKLDCCYQSIMRNGTGAKADKEVR